MFNPKDFIEEKIAEAQKVIGNKRATTAVSGGVDSSIATVIVGRAIGKNLFGVHVDNGYMRYVGRERTSESEYVTKILQENGVNVKLVNAQDEFYSALEGVIDPEQKRKIIGEKFIRVFEREAKDWGAEYLVQGTIAPDWIESGGGLRDTIKSHHNVGALPKEMNLKIFEPNRELYKDETRKVAKELGLPEELYKRQPFPGPGLAIRVLGAPPTKENTEIARIADWIWCREVDDAIKSGKIPDIECQYLAAYAPKWRTVGVQGDVRAYRGMCFLRFVQTVDYMTANFGKISWDVIERASIKITNELKDNISRVFYDVSHKPPGTIEFE